MEQGDNDEPPSLQVTEASIHGLSLPLLDGVDQMVGLFRVQRFLNPAGFPHCHLIIMGFSFGSTTRAESVRVRMSPARNRFQDLGETVAARFDFCSRPVLNDSV